MAKVEVESIPGKAISSRPGQRKLSLLCILTIILSTSSMVFLEDFPTVQAEIFGPNVRADDTGMNSTNQGVPSVAVSKDGRIYVAWDDQRNDNLFEDLYATVSVDGGGTFGRNIRINDDTDLARQYGVDIATNSSNGVHAVWMDWRNDADGLYNPGGGVDGKNNVTIYYSNSTDGGLTWSPNSVLSNSSMSHFDFGPRIAIDSKDVIHVVWGTWLEGTGLNYILYTRSENRGGTFSEPKRIDNSSGTAIGVPSIAIDEKDIVYAVWEDDRNVTTGKDIWFSKSTNSGTSFKGHKRVNNDVGLVNQEHPQISSRNGLIGVVWSEFSTSSNISFASSFDQGASFNNPVSINDDINFVPREYPSIWINESHYVSIAWMTKRNGDEDIYFSNSTDRGLSFSSNQKVNDDSGTANQRLVDLTMDSNGYGYLVWMDYRNGNWDIYFTRAPPEIADLEPVDISSNPSGPVTEWVNVNLNATIRNNGDREATDVLVRFFDGDPSFNIQIGQDQILPRIDANGGMGYAETQWIATPGGSHTIYIVVDPENNVTESNETNNAATANINVISLRPPTITQAVLSGKDLRNVTVNWSLSPDDGMGSMTVTGYRIYRNMTYDPDGLGYSLFASIPNSTSMFTDAGAGEGDLNNYFYQVCARDVNNTTGCSRTQAGKFTRPLVRGPNLASIPLIQSDESVEKVLQTIEFDKAWVYDSFNEKWKWHVTFKPYKGELKSINETQGFWVNVTNDCNFTVAGVVPIQTDIHLSGGWNLVGYPSFQQDYTVMNLEVDVTAERIEGFDSLTPPYFLRLMLGGDILETGFAYWLNVTAETTWIVRNE